MDVIIQPVAAEHVDGCARVLFSAFANLTDRHGFPRDVPDVDLAAAVVRHKIAHQATFGAVALVAGQVAGVIFMLRSDPICGIGPVGVDPALQGLGIGQLLLQEALNAARGWAGIRLTQDSYNVASLALYASLGFDVREPLVLVEGRPRSAPSGHAQVRTLQPSDMAASVALYQSVHGIDRTNELREALNAGLEPRVLLRDGRIVAYTSRTPIVFDGHGVAETEADLRELILGVAAQNSSVVSLVVPTRQGAFFRWCLAEGLRVVKPLTLMTLGAYQEPHGFWFPSVLY